MADQLVVTESLSQQMVEAGANLLRAIDGAGMNVTAAFWFFLDEPDSWRLIIASPDALSSGPRSIYGRLQTVLRNSDNGQIALRDISAVAPSDPLVSLMRMAIRTGARDVAGIRFSRNTINGQFIRDAYIYRMA